MLESMLGMVVTQSGGFGGMTMLMIIGVLLTVVWIAAGSSDDSSSDEEDEEGAAWSESVGFESVGGDASADHAHCFFEVTDVYCQSSRDWNADSTSDPVTSHW